MSSDCRVGSHGVRGAWDLPPALLKSIGWCPAWGYVDSRCCGRSGACLWWTGTIVLGLLVSGSRLSVYTVQLLPKVFQIKLETKQVLLIDAPTSGPRWPDCSTAWAVLASVPDFISVSLELKRLHIFFFKSFHCVFMSFCVVSSQVIIIIIFYLFF